MNTRRKKSYLCSDIPLTIKARKNKEKKMKTRHIIAALVALVTLATCESSTNYANQLEQEKKQIEKFLSSNGYKVTNEFPADSVFPENLFYHEDEGEIYFRLDQKGEGDTITTGDKLQVRYIQSTIEEYPVVESYWTTQDLEYPVEVELDNYYYTYSCEGWNDAFRMMQRSNSVATIIVPSNKGFKWATTQTSVTPYMYKITFLVLPK